jgi:hypothetical protein
MTLNTLDSGGQVFAVGLLGGVMLELFHWYSLRREGRLPRYATRIFYWIVSGLMAVTGGLLAWLYLGPNTDAVNALYIGLSAPLILQKVTSNVAHVPGAKGRRSSEWISFLHW